ncbi:MAG: efflux RND transporter permease subunit [Pseudomonadota bacterium]
MTLSDLAVRRPVLATVVNLLVVVLGIAALQQLPVRELPDVDSSVVTVTTTYPGAAAAVIDTEVVEVIEGALSGIAGVERLTSSSRLGRASTVVTFVPGRNIDEAANDVRDAVGRVRAELPDDADEPRILKSDVDADPVMRIAVTSDRLSPAGITDYVERFVLDRLRTIDGVASVEIAGERRYAIRIWLDRRALAARDLTVADVEDALRRNNMELPAGEVRSVERRFAVRVDSRLGDVDAFRNLVIARVGDFPIRLADVATVEVGVADDETRVRTNDRDAIGLRIVRQPQSNTVALSAAVRAELDLLRPNLPAGMSIIIGSDDAVFIGASIRQVVIALGLSLVFVVAVIFAFLASFRATLVPAVTIPVALIGSFLLIHALGFSLNTLTLLALLLAIGLVVDDAIVVLENVQRRIELGETPLVASLRGSRQVTFAVVATSVTLIAVFVPIALLEGAIGRLFVEFGLVLAAAVVISTFVALTACPALASRLLASRAGTGGAAAGLDRLTRWLQDRYRRALNAALRAPLPLLALALVLAGGAVAIHGNIARELVPAEDQAVVFVRVVGPEGATASLTDDQARRIERLAQPLVDDGTVRTVHVIVGSRGRLNAAFLVLRLAPWDERTMTHAEVVGELAPGLRTVPGVRAFAFTPSGLGLRRSGSSALQVVIGGPDQDQVQEWAETLEDAAERNPGLRNVDLNFEQNQAQLAVDIDRQRADDLGVSVEAIAATLRTMLASREVTSWVDRGREYPVILQAREADRRTPADLQNLFVRAGDGETLVPLTALVTVAEDTAPPTLRRYDRLPSVTLSASLKEGYDLGSAIDFVEATAARTLPETARVGFTGESQRFLDASYGLVFTLVLALVIVFLVLAAQFESFVDPIVIMLSVPLALAGAVYALALAGLSLNVFSQIGMVLLIGLTAKNGILIVEFANQLRDEGKSVREAAIEASVLRLRPIVMTIVSTILGAMPLVMASGAGAESRIAIGTVIVGGLSLSSLLTLFLTPVLYDLLARATGPRNQTDRVLADDLGADAGRAGEPR